MPSAQLNPRMQVGQRADQDDGERDADGREQADRQQAAPELRQVEGERGLEDQPGHEREQDARPPPM